MKTESLSTADEYIRASFEEECSVCQMQMRVWKDVDSSARVRGWRWCLGVLTVSKSEHRGRVDNLTQICNIRLRRFTHLSHHPRISIQRTKPNRGTNKAAL
jgi:hypothetical protein